MHFIAENLKFIRKANGWTQGELAKQLGVKRSLIGAYEEGRADPRISFLMHLCKRFGYSMDQWVGESLDADAPKSDTIAGSNLRILPIMVDQQENQERITLVPVQAAAGYLNGYGDVEFIEQLPAFDLPFAEVSRGKTYRTFQTKGDSMLPIPSGAYILCSYVLDWNNIKNDALYIVVSKTEGVVFKRLLNNLRHGYLTLKSDNPDYEPFDVEGSDIAEVWKAEAVTLFDLNLAQNRFDVSLLETLQNIESKLDRLSSK
jgi:transcriptional regulator with XRE-family HTH domain